MTGMSDRQFDNFVDGCLNHLANWRRSLTGEPYTVPDEPYVGSDDGLPPRLPY
jgi:hypothetical protein